MAPSTLSFITFTLEQRQMFSPVGLRALFGYETTLQLTETELLHLLGGVTRLEMKEWKRAAIAKESIILPNDTLNRVRGALIVFQALLQRFPKNHERAVEWLRKPHPAFNQKTPLNAMMDTKPEGILSVMRYVKVQNTLPNPNKATPKPIRRKKTKNA